MALCTKHPHHREPCPKCAAIQLVEEGSNVCACHGPEGKAPLCPCLMREVTVVDGRYVRAGKVVGVVQ